MAKRSVPRILITGNPGSGKSTLMAAIIKDIQPHQIAGLSTPEIRRDGSRLGFKMIDLATGDERILASTSGKGPTVGKYHVNLSALDEMVAVIEGSIPMADFIFIDEIGKMELLSKTFERFVEQVFSLDKPVIAVVHRNFVSRYRGKAKLFTLTRTNFEEVRRSILSVL
jgi:nucleoside-triphosphatase